MGHLSACWAQVVAAQVKDEGPQGWGVLWDRIGLGTQRDGGVVKKVCGHAIESN